MAVICKGTFSYFKETNNQKQFIFENATGTTDIENKMSALLADSTTSMITVTITKKYDGQSE
mgnify:CR=1 FL=1